MVLLIIGLGVSMLNINLGSSQSIKMRNEAKQFANNTALMAEEAVLSNQQWGVDIYRYNPESASDEREYNQGHERYGYRWLVRNDLGDWLEPGNRIKEHDFLFSVGIGLRLELEAYDQELDINLKRKIIDPDVKILSSDNGNKSMDTNPVVPQIWLLSSGEITAFTLFLFDQNDPEIEIQVTGDILGRVTLGDQNEL